MKRTLSKKAIEAIKTNQILRAKLQIMFDKREMSILNWVEKSPADSRLTLPEAVDLIAEESKLPKKEIING